MRLLKKFTFGWLLAIAPLSANYAFDDEIEVMEPFSYFGAEAIYWQVVVDDLNYTTEISFDPVESLIKLDNKTLSFDWEPGFRVWMEFPSFLKGLSLAADYTHLECRDRAKLNSNTANLTAVNLHPSLLSFVNTLFDEAKGKYKVSYKTVDIFLKYPLKIGGFFNFDPYFGISRMSYRQSLDTSYSIANIAAESEWESNYFGIGLRTGISWQCHLGLGLSLFANTSAAMVNGHIHNNNDQTASIPDTATPFKFSYEDMAYSKVMTGYQIRSGLSYTGCSQRVTYSIRVGYEVIDWGSFPTFRRFTEGLPLDLSLPDANVANTIPDVTSNVGFHGFFAGAEIFF